MKKLLLATVLTLLAISAFSQNYATVNTTELNVRDKASKSGNVVEVLSRGDEAKIIGRNGNWYEIELSDGRTGYASSSFLKISNTRSSSENKSTRQYSWSSVLFIGGFVVYLLYKLMSFFGGSSSNKGSRASTSTTRRSSPPAPKSNPAHWYFCNHCAEKVKTTKTPTALNCSRSTFHHWNDLGLVGENNYSCKHCGIIVQTNKQPTALNCSSATFHHWTKL